MSKSGLKADVYARAKPGAICLLLFTPLNLLGHLAGDALSPLSFVSWLGVSFGLFSFCNEMGAHKPLNLAGLLLLAAAFVAEAAALVTMDTSTSARAHLLYAFAVLGALIFWSVALMHRADLARAAGAIGAAVGVGALGLLFAAHLMLGVATLTGFSQLFAALSGKGATTASARLVIDAILTLWSFAAAGLLWTGRIRD